MSSSNKQFTKQSMFRVLLGIILLLIGVNFYYNWQHTGTLSGLGFTKKEVAGIEHDIKTEVEKRKGFKVEGIAMNKESSRKLVGYVKVRFPSNRLVQRACSAFYGDDRRISWKCDK